MKKIVALLVVAFLALSLFGCGGGGRAEDLSDDVYSHGKRAISHAESYLDGRMTAEEAEVKLKAVGTMIEEDSNSESESDGLVKAYVFSLETDILMKRPDSDVREDIDKLNGVLGE